MYIKKAKGPTMVTLNDGSVISRSDLPAPNTRRWVASRKALVVRAVESGLMPAAEACETYDLSEEELSDWLYVVRQHGKAALRATSVQKYRQPKVE